MFGDESAEALFAGIIVAMVALTIVILAANSGAVPAFGYTLEDHMEELRPQYDDEAALQAAIAEERAGAATMHTIIKFGIIALACLLAIVFWFSCNYGE